MQKETYHTTLKNKMDKYVHEVYKTSKKFPKDELYGVVSQLRRSSLSVILNYIEGYARCKNKVHKNFLEISYGSLQESKYLLKFSKDEHYLSEDDYKLIEEMNEEIGAMLWGIIRKL